MHVKHLQVLWIMTITSHTKIWRIKCRRINLLKTLELDHLFIELWLPRKDGIRNKDTGDNLEVAPTEAETRKNCLRLFEHIYRRSKQAV